MIQKFANWLVYDIAGLNSASKLGSSVNFFVYDSIKILVLLFLISIFMGILNAYFPVQKLRKFLTTRKLYGTQYILASVFGAITPFCSCSSIPLFIGFVKGGIPLGVTFSFLITSPLINEVAVAVFAGAFGWKTTAVYISSGLFLGTIGGYVLGKMRLEKYLSPWVQKLQDDSNTQSDSWQTEKISFFARLPEIIRDSFAITRSVVVYVLIGIGVGAAIHGYIPAGFFENNIGKSGIWAVPLTVICAIPMYANAAGIVPVIQVFVAKGVPVGTALAFMMAVVGLSFPEAVLLKKVMDAKLILIFFGTVGGFIILLGYFFNLIF